LKLKDEIRQPQVLGRDTLEHFEPLRRFERLERYEPLEAFFFVEIDTPERAMLSQT
jgi:hypothetical protein